MNRNGKQRDILNFKSLDIFGLKFNFLFNGKEVHKTNTGAFLTLFYTILSLGLFFFFALDLIERKNPRVSFNSSKEQYKKVSVSNKNMTYAYRIENQNGSLLVDESLIYLEAYHINYEMVNNKWMLLKETNLPVKRCHNFDDYNQREAYFGISLEMWYCIDFDNMILGGNWDGNFVSGIYI